MLAQLEEMVRFCRRQGSAKEGWDVVCMGVTPDEDRTAAADLVRQRAERGATWWLESITPYRYGISWDSAWPLDDIRQVIQRGPPVRQ